MTDLDSTFKINDKEYCIETLSEATKSKLNVLKFATERLQELNNQRALLLRAKQSYLDSLKREMLADKAGILFDEN